MPGFADKLAARARDAARRQTENAALLAMIREEGELALKRGDRKAAEAAWSQMLELVVEPADRKAKKPRIPATPPAGVAPVPAASVPPANTTSMAPVSQQSRVRLASYQPPAQKAARKAVTPGAARGPAAPRNNLPILTLDRFEQAMQIARLAAEHDLSELSTRAVRDALRAGPPVVPTNPNETRRVVRMRGVVDDGPVDQASPRVVANLIELERIWQKHKMPAESVYQALRDAVLPATRPSEIFLYAPPLSSTALRRPQSVGALLAIAAVHAGKVDDLKAAIAARQGQVLADLPAKVLSAQLALAGTDSAQSVAAIKTISTRLKTDTSRATAELACHAALPALGRHEPALAGAALDVLDTCVKGLETSGQPEPLGTLLLVLARRQFQLGDAPGGRKRLEAYLEAMEKNTVRYAGDYPLYLRKQQLERIAAEYARAGLWTDALASLARFVDAPAYSYGDPPVDDVLVRLLRQIEASPAKERYQILHDWTMPAQDRRVARILTSLAAGDMAPEAFSQVGSDNKRPGTPGFSSADTGGMVSTASALIEAARQAGALDQLGQEAAAAAELKADRKVENAEILFLLIELARGNAGKITPRIEARLAEVTKENEAHVAASAPRAPGASTAPVVRSVSNRPDRILFPWSDSLLASAALRTSDPAIASLGMRLALALEERAKMVNDPAVLAHIRGELAQARARQALAPATANSINLASWHPVSSRYSYQRRTGPARRRGLLRKGISPT